MLFKSPTRFSLDSNKILTDDVELQTLHDQFEKISLQIKSLVIGEFNALPISSLIKLDLCLKQLRNLENLILARVKKLKFHRIDSIYAAEYYRNFKAKNNLNEAYSIVKNLLLIKITQDTALQPKLFNQVCSSVCDKRSYPYIFLPKKNMVWIIPQSMYSLVPTFNILKAIFKGRRLCYEFFENKQHLLIQVSRLQFLTEQPDKINLSLLNNLLLTFQQRSYGPQLFKWYQFSGDYPKLYTAWEKFISNKEKDLLDTTLSYISKLSQENALRQKVEFNELKKILSEGDFKCPELKNELAKKISSFPKEEPVAVSHQSTRQLNNSQPAVILPQSPVHQKRLSQSTSSIVEQSMFTFRIQTSNGLIYYKPSVPPRNL